MQVSTKYRHELKYFINYTDYVLLSKRLKATLPSDANVNNHGEYFIRSLYFDDLSDTAFREKLDGVDSRDKFRIRTYDLNKKVIKLERKRKDAFYIKKDSIALTYSEYERLINYDFRFLYEREESFARSMFVEFSTRMLTPRVIVDYIREPYVFPYDDVRITFDKSIRTGYRGVDMFNPDLPTYAALPHNTIVLEVKFNSAMPYYVGSLLQISAPVRSSVSKYVICRKFEL